MKIVKNNKFKKMEWKKLEMTKMIKEHYVFSSKKTKKFLTEPIIKS